MNKWILMLALVASLNVSAGSLRVDGGRVLINKGDSIDILLMNLGEPKHKVTTVVCVEQRGGNSPCTAWGTAETWFYRYDDLNWKIQIFGDTIQDINWSRY